MNNPGLHVPDVLADLDPQNLPREDLFKATAGPASERSELC